MTAKASLDDPPIRYLERFAWLATATACLTIGLKVTAAWITGSVGLLSDAAESVVNLVAAIVALVALKAAGKEPDPDFTHGREKAEYLSAGVEGTMIMIAAAFIIKEAVMRLVHPAGVERLGIGLAVSVVASLLNLAVGVLLVRTGKSHRSITLEADGRHLLTDVWTSIGVVVAIVLVWVTDWTVLDPLIAIGVALNIVIAGYGLIRRAVRGLMDASVPPEDLARIEKILASHSHADVQFHALRTRQSGRRSFVTFHMLVPGNRSVVEAHDLVDRVEAELVSAVPGLSVISHIEPLEDPRSYADEGLDRPSFLKSVPSISHRQDGN